MKTTKQGIIGAVAVLIVSALHAYAVVDQALEVSGTNLVLSWPSRGYEQYLVQYRPTLDPSTPWVDLTNAYPANSTNRTTFIVPCCSLAALGGGSAAMRSAEDTSKEWSAVAATKEAELVTDKSELSELMAIRLTGSDEPVPLALYPPGMDTNGLIIFESSEMKAWEKENLPSSEIAAESYDPAGNEPMSLTSGGCDCPDMGFFRVWHIPDFLATITNYTFDGPIFIPVDFKDYLDRVENIEVMLDGVQSDYAVFTSLFYNNQTNWGVGIYFDRMASGTHSIQLRSTLRISDEVVGDDVPLQALLNSTRSIWVDNQVAFTNWDDLVWNNTNYTFRAKLKNLNTDWWIDIYDAWGGYINGSSGHTSNGEVEWTWDLTDWQANPRDTLENDPFFVPYITFEPASAGGPPAAPVVRRTPVPTISYPAVGHWLVTYQDTFYEPGTTTGGYFTNAMLAIAGGPALRNIPNSTLPLKYGTNFYTQTERDNSWIDLKATMASPQYRNLYYFGHGWEIGVGGDMHTYGTNGAVTGGKNLRPSKAFLTSKYVRDVVTFNKHSGARPYRFVWLDGCKTALGDWPESFGVNKGTNDLGYYTNRVTNPSGKRPSAFVGWSVSPGGDGWGTVQPFFNCRTQWMFDWQQNWQSESLIDALEYGRQTSNWIPNSKFWDGLRVFGYINLKMNEFNQKNDWPQP